MPSANGRKANFGVWKEINIMADKKKNNMVLVEVSGLNDDELDAAIENALSSLFEETEDQKAAQQNKRVAKKLPKKNI